VSSVTNTLEYRGRYRAYPGAITGMKPPQYAVWAFQQLGARPGDELVDLYPGSGAVSQAWRRYTTAPSTDDTSRADARVDDDTSRPPGDRGTERRVARARNRRAASGSPLR
jgi:hypothetical protein